MLNIYSDSKIYVYCPAGIVTGGAELLHQLVSVVRDNGQDAYIIYYGDAPHTVPNDYRCYNIQTAESYEDDKKNVLVLFEPLFYMAAESSNVQKVLWWLSVDNLFATGASFISVRDLYPWYPFGTIAKLFVKRLVKSLMGRAPKTLTLRQLAECDVVSGYQSEYAHHFILNNGFKTVVPLKDFINIDHCKGVSFENREDLVLYNPKKGFEFTQKLIAAAPDVKWVPIQNMSRDEVVALMRRAKVYVDFGYHPGKDRLPRECAMNGLCVITGSRGSARFFEDVRIESKYRFDEKRASVSDIVARIRHTVSNYSECIADFAYYRKMISLEHKEFLEQVAQLFSVSR